MNSVSRWYFSSEFDQFVNRRWQGCACLQDDIMSIFGTGKNAIATMYKDSDLHSIWSTRCATYRTWITSQVPLLNASFQESMLFYERSTRTAKTAQDDTTSPIGGGWVIKVEKGKSGYLIHHAFPFDDKVVNDALSFRPDCFLENVDHVDQDVPVRVRDDAGRADVVLLTRSRNKKGAVKAVHTVVDLRRRDEDYGVADTEETGTKETNNKNCRTGA